MACRDLAGVLKRPFGQRWFAMKTSERKTNWMFGMAIVAGGLGFPLAVIIAFDYGVLYGGGYGDLIQPTYGFAIGTLLVGGVLFALIEGIAIATGVLIVQCVYRAIDIVRRWHPKNKLDDDRWKN